MYNWNWKRIGIVSLITGVLLWWPPTRGIIRFILPLGRGIDDLIVWAAILIGLGIWSIRSWNAWKARKDVYELNRAKNWKLRAGVITFLIVMVALILPPTNQLANVALMGRSINDVSIFIYLGVYASAILLTWLIMSKGKHK